MRKTKNDFRDGTIKVDTKVGTRLINRSDDRKLMVRETSRLGERKEREVMEKLLLLS